MSGTRVSGTRIIPPSAQNGLDLSNQTISSPYGNIQLITSASGHLVVSNSITPVGTSGNTNANAGNMCNPTGQDISGSDQGTYYSTTAQRQLAQAYFGGGVGVEKDLVVGGLIFGRLARPTNGGISTATDSIFVYSTASNQSYYVSFTDSLNSDAYLWGNAAITYNPSTGLLNVPKVDLTGITNSTSTTSGALVVAGGVGLGGNLNVGGAAFIGTNSYVANTLIITSATVSTLEINNNTNSTSTTTGAVVVEGGIGLGGNLNVGGQVNVSGSLLISSTTNSTSTTSGALVVDGGVGIGLCVNIGNAAFIGTNSYIANSLIITAETTSTLAINNGTASTSTNTGALIVEGGVGIGGAAFIGTNSYIDNILIITSATVSTLAINNSTASTSTNTGALIVEGGAGIGQCVHIGGAAFIGTNSYINNSLIITAQTTSTLGIHNCTVSTSTNSGALTVTGGLGIGGCTYIGGILDVLGGVRIASTTNSVSTTTGALVLAGGAGIGKCVHIGGGTFIGTNSYVANSLIITAVTTSTLAVNNSTTSASTNTGAVVVEGGVGVGGAVFIGTNSYVANSLIITAKTTSTLAVDNCTNSASTSTGAVTVTGGVGIGKNLNVGGAAYIGTDSYIFCNIIVTSPFSRVFTVSNTSQSVSTTTGALVVGGGIGLGKNLNVGGAAQIQSTASSTSTNTGALVVSGGVGAGGNLNVGGSAQIQSTASSTSTNTGALVVSGGVGVCGSIWAADDIHVNNLSIGRGAGTQDIIIAGIATTGTCTPLGSSNNIRIGYGATLDISADNTNTVAIGNNALGASTGISNSVAVGNCSFSSLAANSNGNVGIGHNAGKMLVCGIGNILIGENAGANISSGNNNFIFGACSTQLFTHGNNNISINGYTLQDGQSNQISIGAVVYYNGAGTTFVSSNVQMGQGGAPTQACGPMCCSAGLQVFGGALITGNLFIGGNTNCGLCGNLHVHCNATVGKCLSVTNTISVAGCGISKFQGSVEICGSIIAKNGTFFSGSLIPVNCTITLGQPGNAFGALHLTGQTLYLGTVTFKSPDEYNLVIASPHNAVTATMGNLVLNSGINSLGGCTGSLQITGGGGACISGDLYVGGQIYGASAKAHNIYGGSTGSLVFQAAACTTYFLPIGGTSTVLVSTGVDAVWDDLRTIVSGYSVSSANSATFSITATNALNSYVYPRCGDATLYVPLVNIIDGISPEIGDPNLTYVITTGTSSGAVIWNSGTSMLNVPGSIYSNEGSSQENNLLYTPRMLVGDYTVLEGVNPRVGDFWADPDSSALYQYINDHGNSYWLQITVL